MLFIVPGLTSHSEEYYIKNIAKVAHERGFDVVAINYRGLAKCPLTTPKLYESGSLEDVREPMKSYYEKYCKKSGKKVLAIGCSFGGNLLTNVLGKEGSDTFISAACLIQAPMNLVEMGRKIRYEANGFYDRALGRKMKAVMIENEPYLKDYYKQKHNMDLWQTLQDMPNSGCLCNEIFIAPMFGYENESDYYSKTQCSDRIKDIKTPTLFINAIDDPIIGNHGIDFESIRNNKFTVLATTEHGGHLAYEEKLFSTEQWFLGPALDYLNIFRYS